VSGLLAAAFVVLVSLHLSMAITFGRLLSTAVWLRSAEGIASWSAAARQKTWRVSTAVSALPSRNTFTRLRKGAPRRCKP